jgi:hypothetical protein
MNKPLSDPTQPYRSLLAGYNEAIRACDMKANIAFLFVAFMMGSVLYNYTYFPNYLPIEFVLMPFLIVYTCLFMVLVPRYPKRGAQNFRVARNLTGADFEHVGETENDISQLKLRCAIFSDILWWKTLFIRTGFLVTIVCVFLTMFLLLYVRFT